VDLRPVTAEVVSEEEGKKLAEQFGCLYAETSALTNFGVAEVFENCVRCYRRGLAAGAVVPGAGRNNKKCLIC
jgi:hypothetical protein